MHALIRRRLQPAQRFGIEIGIADKLAAVDEIAAEEAHRPLDLPLGLRPIRATRANAKAPVPREAEKLRILEQLAAIGPLVVDDDGFELIEEQLVRHAAEIRKGGFEAGDDRRERLAWIEL